MITQEITICQDTTVEVEYELMVCSEFTTKGTL